MASPTVNAKNISFSNVTTSSVTVNWTIGNGGNRLLVVSPDAPINAFPLDGTDYTGNVSYGSGSMLGANNYVVYNGTGNSATITGLTSGKTYYFRLVEYNKNATTGNNALYLLGDNPVSSIDIPGVLPITISYFKAIKINDTKAEIDWQTRQEINSNYFDVERSTNGNSFSSIGQINAKGNSQTISNYSISDNTPAAGKNYYRLKEVDNDGHYTFSNVISLDFSIPADRFKVISYEGKNFFTVIKNDNANFSNAYITVRNTAGQLLIKQLLMNTNSQTVSTSILVNGIYFATIFDGAKAYSYKIVIH
jgi:hypothetical protein